MKTVNSGPLSASRHKEIREKLLVFLKKPRTRDDIANEFNISGTSAGAFLSALRLNPRIGLRYDNRDKTHVIGRPIRLVCR